MSHALVVNAYSVGNWGDVAIVEGIVGSLRRAGYERVTVAPVDWAEDASGWSALGADDVVRPLVSLHDWPARGRRSRPLKLAHALGRFGRSMLPRATDPGMVAYHDADLIVSAGGGYLGGSKPGGNAIKAMNIRAGVIAGRPTVVAPITVNPSSPTVRRIVHWGLSGSRVFVRDDESLSLLAEARIGATLVPDIAILAPSLRAARALTSAMSAGPAEREQGTIGWAPRSYRADHAAWGTPAAAEAIAFDAMRSVLGSSDRRLRFFAHVRAGQADDDMVAVERLRSRFTTAEQARIEVAPPAATLSDAVCQYGSLDVLLTSRMHAAIFALAMGTPALAVGYEPKVLGVMRDLGLADRVMPVDGTASAAAVAARIVELAHERERSRTLAAFDGAIARFAPFDAALTGAAR